MKKERLMVITLFSILLVSMLSVNVMAITADDVFENPVVKFITTVVLGMKDRQAVQDKIGNEKMNDISALDIFVVLSGYFSLANRATICSALDIISDAEAKLHSSGIYIIFLL